MDTQIFINRSLRMDKIKCVGFDMDATLAIYNSPISEELAFNLSINHLIDIGYPKQIQELKYKTNFAVRNAWFDKRYGNLLKTDEHCNILTAFHGFKKLDKKEIRQYYPNKHVNLEEIRIFVLNTVFNVPEALLLASIVDYFESHENEYLKLPNREGFNKKDTQQTILYSAIFDDCRRTIDWVHTVGDYKKTVVKNLMAYIAQDSRAVQMMKSLSKSGKKLFLLTNSPWMYTDIEEPFALAVVKIRLKMKESAQRSVSEDKKAQELLDVLKIRRREPCARSYAYRRCRKKILMSHVMGKTWQQLFDVVIVEGNKPKWFLQDIPFKEVDPATGSERVGSHSGPLRKGEIYSRGCASDFKQRMGLAGKDILYVGDHIFGDVLKSKKTGGWRTLLIVPELDREMKIWASQKAKFNELISLNDSLSASESAEGIVKKETLKEISKITEEMEAEYGLMGSLMRCGWRQTHFASQLKKYADLYTYNAYNIAEYSPLHYFNSPILLLPHEEKFMQTSNKSEKEECDEEDT